MMTLPAFCSYSPPHGSETDTTSGTFTVPAGVYLLKSIELVGASGGAGGNSPTRGGSGSGGGSYCKKNNIAVTPGDLIAYVVGLAGIGGTTGVVAGTDGGSSTVVTLGLTAGGGLHGANNAGAGGAGGTASGGDVNTSGSAGTAGSLTIGGPGGNAAPPLGGAGGAAGLKGSAPGGGSGGNAPGLAVTGQDGRNGRAVFTW